MGFCTWPATSCYVNAFSGFLHTSGSRDILRGAVVPEGWKDSGVGRGSHLALPGLRVFCTLISIGEDEWEQDYPNFVMSPCGINPSGV